MDFSANLQREILEIHLAQNGLCSSLHRPLLQKKMNIFQVFCQ